MRRLALPLAIAAVLALTLVAAAGCGSSSGGSSGGSSQPSATSTSHTPVTLTVWHPWTVPSEKKGFQRAVAGFHTQYPWITLKIVSFPDSATFDQQVIKAVQAGGGPDVAISFGPDFVGQYAHDGLLIDLNPYLQRDNLSTGTFAPASLTYTQFEGKRVALPVLTDAYGLYYNKDMFAKAGIAGAPKTMTELMADAKKLTVRNADGSIKVAGFVPLDTWEELDTTDLARAWGGQYFNAQGQPQLATDPAWAAAMTWQKQLVDWYGYTNILKFFSTYTAQEFNASNAFETGKAAMVFDGEWRTAMIKGDGSKVNYGTAPFPAADTQSALYGVGRVGGTVTGIPKTSKNPDAAWLLVKYMATDTNFLVALANGLGNVPTTTAAATSPDLTIMTPQFKTFVAVWNNPKSSYAPPITSSGSGYSSLLTTFDQKWVAGKVSDLQAGLKQVDQQIVNQLSLGQAP
jgi:multiple sugar transport system substrate-binding protein